ncbi:hypothetical protein CYMTET_29667, partial [Cymbomonas tetramitiformis]
MGQDLKDVNAAIAALEVPTDVCAEAMSMMSSVAAAAALGLLPPRKAAEILQKANPPAADSQPGALGGTLGVGSRAHTCYLLLCLPLLLPLPTIILFSCPLSLCSSM